MTLQECKDKVAEKHGLTNWENACFVWAGFVKQMEPLMDEAAELYAQQRVEEATRWIPVSDRLPEPNVKVLVLLTYGRGNQSIEMSYTTTRFPDCFDSFHANIITHWQPLPKAPTV